MAAKQYQTIAELYESDLADIPNAIAYYEKSADLFKTEENNSLVHLLLIYLYCRFLIINENQL